MITLNQGLAALDIEVPGDTVDQLLAFVAALEKWNETYNLTSVPPGEPMIVQHLLDSLSILPYVSSDASIADVGSGGGLPGIPLSLCRPCQSVTLVDSNGKKTRFLEHVRILLDLSNVTVVQSRVEDFETQFDVVTCRAFASLARIAGMTAHLLSPGARVLAMKADLGEELEQDLSPLAVQEVISLKVPGIEGPRHLVILERA
jgi:16S rRNA (guanine527-N7)-methyltransferase